MEKTEQETLIRLAEARDQHPELAEVIRLQYDLLAARLEVDASVSVPEYTEDALRARIRSGVAMLRPQEMNLDWEVFAGLFRRTCEITAQHRPDLASQLNKLGDLPYLEPEQLRVLTAEYLESGHLALSDHARFMGAEDTTQTELLGFVLNHSLRPFLKAYAGVFVPLLEERLGVDWDTGWQRGSCPVCGGEPDLAYLDAESGARYLVCSRCDTAWLYPRIRCPFCDTTDPEQLSYYGSDDKKHRVYVCDNCERYIKAIDLRQIGRPMVFPVARVTTIDLDVAARKNGYQ
jgi:hypothetical protein